MPIKIDGELIKLTQKEFAAIAYEVIHEAFAIYRELGALFDEAVYRDAMAARFKTMRSEVKIEVLFQDFSKSYYMDAVLAGGGIFEFKAIKNLDDNHRSQLLNYLLLTEMRHGKLINFGPREVQHEFLNTTLTLADRRYFNVSENDWIETDGFERRQKDLFIQMVKDWGTGLSGALYREALMHLLGGEENLNRDVNIFNYGRAVGTQIMPVCGKATSLHITSFSKDTIAYQKHIGRSLRCTDLDSAQWINITHNKITFKTLQV